MLKRINFCACLNMSVMAVISPFLTGFDAAEILYIVSAALTFAFGLFCRLFLHKRLRLAKPLFYALMGGMCAYAVALSAFLYPDIHGVTIVGIFMLIPMIVLDETWRVNSVLFVYYLAACVFTIVNKPPDISLDDCVTCGAFVIFGMLIGSYMRAARMNAIAQRRQLQEQRDMDALTKLPNRRLLFETLEKRGQNVTGIFMADIDKFKEYNDRFGHQAGDDYLSQLGELFAKFSEENGIKIFRYGGEEFLGLCCDKNADEMDALACRLVETVRARNLLDAGVTLSVGYAYKEPFSDVGYERLISVADTALYEAKRLGRDRAVGRAGTPLRKY